MAYRNQAAEGHGLRLSMSAHQIKPKYTSARQPDAQTTARPRVDDAVLRPGYLPDNVGSRFRHRSGILQQRCWCTELTFSLKHRHHR
ncbi:hypothetical protein WJX77_005659 [Trebouxia sp. C0004]